MDMERRVFDKNAAPVDLVKRADGKKMLTGYGAVFYREGQNGTEYQLWDDVYERIAPTAFDRALKESHDARGLFNHDPNNLLGRVASGTMRLAVDKTGLRYEIDLDEEDPDHQRVLRKIERGDLTGSSFSFRPTKVTWESNEDRELRVIEDLDLYDTGPVTFPAYEGTSVSARQENLVAAARSEHAAWKEHRMATENAEETPVEETPVEETPVEETPVEETPVEETRTEETPTQETPQPTSAETTKVTEDVAEDRTEEATPEETPVEGAPTEESEDEVDAERACDKEKLAYRERVLIASLWD